jgi:hypothetical protein
MLAADCLMINIIAHPELRACGVASGKMLECMSTSSCFFARTMILVSACLYRYAQFSCLLVISMIS